MLHIYLSIYAPNNMLISRYIAIFYSLRIQHKYTSNKLSSFYQHPSPPQYTYLPPSNLHFYLNLIFLLFPPNTLLISLSFLYLTFSFLFIHFLFLFSSPSPHHSFLIPSSFHYFYSLLSCLIRFLLSFFLSDQFGFRLNFRNFLIVYHS